MTIEINAKVRDVTGTGASRRLRKSGRLPAIVYGNGDAQMLDLDHNEIFYKLRDESFHASILNLNVDGKAQEVLLRDYTMHPFRQQVMHIDFQRVDDSTVVTKRIPLHFINGDIAPAVKTGGGKITTALANVEISCPAKDLPVFIEVDLGKLNLGDSLRVRDLALPAGASVVTHGTNIKDAAVAIVQGPRGGGK